jgi:hypothetical protein
VWITTSRTERSEVLVSRRNTPLSVTGRLRLARCVVEQRWPLRRAAERFQVSVSTAKRWADRYRAHGEAGLVDRSSRPHRSLGAPRLASSGGSSKSGCYVDGAPARIAGLLGLNPSTVHRVLTRYGLNRLAGMDRATGRVIRRYERATPGELVHVDIKKLGNIPMAVATRSTDAPSGSDTAQPTVIPPGRGSPAITPTWATATCTTPLTITPGWPIPRSWRMRPKKPPRRSGNERRPSSPPPGSVSPG